MLKNSRTSTEFVGVKLKFAHIFQKAKASATPDQTYTITFVAFVTFET